jgi:integrase
MRWDAVATIGGVLAKRLPSGKVRYCLDFGRRQRKRIRLYSCPNPADPTGQPIPLVSREQAERVLASIRAALLNGKTLDQVLSEFRGHAAPEQLVRHHLGLYMDLWESRVAAGQRSINSVRELRGYAKADGHFSWWVDCPVHGISYKLVEDWHGWLARRTNQQSGKLISAKSVRNASHAFKTFLHWLKRREVIDRVPEFPTIKVAPYVPTILTPEQQEAVLAAIPWELRGAFLVGAREALRLSEICALDLDDYQDGKIRVSKARKGRQVDAPIGDTKNRSAEWRELWDEELVRWIDWRLAQVTPESRLRGEVALFPNPRAAHAAKRWATDSIERAWDKACKQVGVRTPFQQGTRHSTLTALAQRLPERVLRSFSRHASGRSLDHYAKPKATPEAIVRALRPEREVDELDRRPTGNGTP